MTGSTALTRSPELYPVEVDPSADAVRFVPLTRADYAAASFLDGRMPQSRAVGEWVPWPAVRAAAAGLPRRCHFIFHISHCGSTLLSRLLDHHPALFGLREPAILRGLAEAPPAEHPGRGEYDRRLDAYLGLWSRTFEPGQTAVVKATSFVGEIGGDLLARVPAARAVLMYVPPATFLRALLDGAMGDITGSADARLRRLHRRLAADRWRHDALSPGELVAMSWLCEMLALDEAAVRYPGRVLWVDFDRFLGDPAAGLAAVLAHLGAEADERAVRAAVTGPTMSEYAKAPGQAYDVRAREQLLYQTEQKFGPEIARGMEFLRAAAELPAVRGMLARVTPRRPSAAAGPGRPPDEAGRKVEMDRQIAMAFPTPVGQFRVPPAEAAEVNHALRSLILERERVEPSQSYSNAGGWHSRQDLLEWPHPAVARLREWVYTAVNHMVVAGIELAKASGGARSAGGGLSVVAWANVSRHTHYHRLHNHPGSAWSGVYYVSTGTPAPDQPLSGVLELIDPRPFTEMVTTPGSPFGQRAVVRPEPGLLVLFPGWLYHFVNPFYGEGERISIAFNVTAEPKSE